MRILLPVFLLLTAVSASAQPAYTAADYARAEKFMGYNTNPLVFGTVGRPTFIEDSDLFWYRVTRDKGSEFILADPSKATKAPAFDQAKLGAILATASNNQVDLANMPFQSIDFTRDRKAVLFSAFGKRWKCTVDGQSCDVDFSAPATARRAPGGGRGGAARNDSPSPDGKKTVFIKDFNLWVRDVATAREEQLTTDGVKDFGYATDNAGWVKSERPIVLWSPDSKKVATFQQDERGVGEMYLVNTAVGHPKLEAWKYPLPGDD